MFDPKMSLLLTVLIQAVEQLESDPSADGPWSDASNALTAVESTREKEPDLASAVDNRDLAGLKSLIGEWHSGARHLPEQDRDVLKRAMKAFRKSLKVTRLDADSSIGGGPMSSGRDSAIVGIVPPPRYPIEVWRELARQKRLIDSGKGIFELPPGG